MSVIERLEGKIDKLGDRLESVDKTLISQHEVLKEHIRRTEALERALEPVRVHVSRAQGVVKFISLVTAAFAGLEGLAALLHFMKGPPR